MADNTNSRDVKSEANDPTERNDEETVKRQGSTTAVYPVPGIYKHDVVKCNNNVELLGVVTEVAGDSDSDDGIDVDDEDDDDDEDEDDAESDENDAPNSNQNNAGNEIDGDDADEGSEDAADDNDDDSNEGSNDDNHEVDDEDNGDDEESNHSESESLKDGQVRVLWIDMSETLNTADDISVVDRSFLQGDIVASAAAPTGQLGIVEAIHVTVDLLSMDGPIMKVISSKHIGQVCDFAVGDYVTLGPWLGRVEDVLDNVTVLFDDGSICKVLKADPSQLRPLSGPEHADIPYYPGQRVKATSSSIFKNSRWLAGSWKASRLECTVMKVQAGALFIHWIASANAGNGAESVTPPNEEQKPKNVTLLSGFRQSNWQLGDWCLPPVHLHGISFELTVPGTCTEIANEDLTNEDTTVFSTACSTLCNAKLNDAAEAVSMNSCIDGKDAAESNLNAESVSENGPIQRKKPRKIVVKKDKKLRKKIEAFDKALQIINIRTKVDVVWQDGSRELGRDGTSLIPIDTPGDHEFSPECYVVEKASDEEELFNEVRRVGVIKNVNSKDRTACVRWLKPISRPEDPKEFDREEIVSVYELEEHPDYDYCFGDVVVRLTPVSAPGGMASVENNSDMNDQHASSTQALPDRRSKKHKKTKQSLKDEAGATDLSWVGIITNLKDGDIEVKWADGMISVVGPQAVYVVDRDEDDYDSSDEVDSWDTFDGVADSPAKKGQNVELHRQTSGTSEKERNDSANFEDNNGGGPLAIPLAALGFFTRLATDLFMRGRNTTFSALRSSGNSLHANDHQGFTSDGGALNDEVKLPKASSAGDFDVEASSGIGIESLLKVGFTDVELHKTENAVDAGSSFADSQTFIHFDIVKEPSDHYYFGGIGKNVVGGKHWAKKIQQDWNILEKNLPNEIYVRVYEDRMDLLRAVIMGACGTPYQDGLFFFDFQLPPEYPQVPPSAYYHSGGLRLNPNLYEDGKVCLSLLNTWNGKGTEMWDPSSSSILQVLVSIQGLVLNPKPYFNEAGYDKQVGTAEGEKNSLSYNENTFLLSCRSMLYIIRKPPKDFEDLVKQHFKNRGYYILKACEQYMNGCVVGTLTEGASRSSKSDEGSNSAGFKLMLGKIIPRLITALKELGADCCQFEHLLIQS